MPLRVLLVVVVVGTMYLGCSARPGWVDVDRARDVSGALVAVLAFAGLHRFLFGEAA